MRHRDGSWRWLQGGGVNYEAEDGKIHVVAVSRDVTDRVRAEEERRKLDQWVQQGQKFESLGVMAGGIAHDFNNLLTPILGDSSLVLMDLPQDSPVRARIEILSDRPREVLKRLVRCDRYRARLPELVDASNGRDLESYEVEAAARALSKRGFVQVIRGVR